MGKLAGGGMQSVPSTGFGPVFVLERAQSRLGLPTTHAPPERSLRPRGLPHVEFLLFLHLQSRWLTTPSVHVNRGRSFLTTTPQTCWGTSFSLFEERPTEGLDVT